MLRARTSHRQAHPLGGEAARTVSLGHQAKGRASASTDLERTLLAHEEHATALVKARRFAEAQDQFELAVSLVRRAKETTPDLRLDLSLLARLSYHYGARLARLEEFTAATHYLAQAREYLYRLEVKTLFRRRGVSMNGTKNWGRPWWWE